MSKDSSDKILPAQDSNHVDESAEIFQLEYENAKSRLAEQQETLRDFSHEGMRMFRLIILLIAAIAAFVGALSPDLLVHFGDTIISESCAVSSEFGCVSVGMITILSGILLVIAAVLNVVAAGHEAVGTFNFTNPEDIYQSLKNPEVSVTQHHKNQLEECIKRIDHNDRIISGTESILAMGKFVLLLSIFGFASLFYITSTGAALPAVYWFIAFILIFIPPILIFSYVPKRYLKVDRWSFSYTSLYDRNYEEKISDSSDDE